MWDCGVVGAVGGRLSDPPHLLGGSWGGRAPHSWLGDYKACSLPACIQHQLSRANTAQKITTKLTLRKT